MGIQVNSLFYEIFIASLHAKDLVLDNTVHGIKRHE